MRVGLLFVLFGGVGGELFITNVLLCVLLVEGMMLWERMLVYV